MPALVGLEPALLLPASTRPVVPLPLSAFDPVNADRRPPDTHAAAGLLLLAHVHAIAGLHHRSLPPPSIAAKCSHCVGADHLIGVREYLAREEGSLRTTRERSRLRSESNMAALLERTVAREN